MKIKLSKIYLVVNVILISVSIFFGGLWLINTQVAFISSMLVVFASYFAYRGVVQKRLEEGDIPKERELLDRIDDKFELFDDETSRDDLSKEEFVKLYKEERKKSGGIKLTFMNLFKSKRGIFNPIRLLAYAFMIIAIMVLIRHNLFEPIAFLIGISGVPIATLIAGYTLKNY